MKKIIVISTFFLFVSISGYSQVKHEVSVTYGKSFGGASYTLLREGFLMGNSSSSLKKNNTIGIRYFRSLRTHNKLKFELGVNYLNGTLEIKPATTGDSIRDAPHYQNIQLFSSPVYLNYRFWKYFFLTGGVLFDYQNSESHTYSGIGIGYGFGLGARYNCKNCFFYINPKVERHLFFSKSYGLIEFGLMAGMGFSF